jgi:hypothetical protein
MQLSLSDSCSRQRQPASLLRGGERKKKGVTRVAHAATLQLNPACEAVEEEEGCYIPARR